MIHTNLLLLTRIPPLGCGLPGSQIHSYFRSGITSDPATLAQHDIFPICEGIASPFVRSMKRNGTGFVHFKKKNSMYLCAEILRQLLLPPYCHTVYLVTQSSHTSRSFQERRKRTPTKPDIQTSSPYLSSQNLPGFTFMKRNP